MGSRTAINDVSERVRAFYETLPFNYFGSLDHAVEFLRRNPVLAYPDLDRLLLSGDIRSVIEFGCGTGWFSNAVALHYQIPVLGIDMTSRALDRAQEIADSLKLKPQPEFCCSDLFSWDQSRMVDLVVSLGVLHHTQNARLAFSHVTKFIGPGGWVFVGLYHLYGRRVMLGMFRDILQKEGEEAAFRHFRALHPASSEDTHIRSWFRDQVLHPHETHHTLQEVLGWLKEENFELVSTSVNGFREFGNPEELLPLEQGYEEISYRRNVRERRFFPGFFTALARRSR